MTMRLSNPTLVVVVDKILQDAPKPFSSSFEAEGVLVGFELELELGPLSRISLDAR
jgi:hypothetical protein